MDFNPTQFNPVTEFPSSQDSSEFAPGKTAEEKVLELPPYSPKERLELLSPEEQQERERLELLLQEIWEQGKNASQQKKSREFEEINVFAQIREKRLYRSTHKTFEAYCRQIKKCSRRQMDYLIITGNAYHNLRMHHSQSWLDGSISTIPDFTLPTNKEQLKPLTSLESAEQYQVWLDTLQEARTTGRSLSGSLVKEMVRRFQNNSLVPILGDCRVDDAFILIGLKGKQKKYSCCWAIVTKLTDSNVTVEVEDVTITVKLDNLNKINSQDVKRQLLQISKRIKRLLAIESLDPEAKVFLKDLCKRTNFSYLHENGLSCIEEKYGATESEGEL